MLIDGLAQWAPEDDERVEEQTVGGLLRWAAAQALDEVALVAGTPDAAQRRRWTFGQLLAESEQVARVHKVPKIWHRTDALPLTGSGKVMKHVLRDQLSRDLRS